jgi:hypothetical protein
MLALENSEAEINALWLPPNAAVGANALPSETCGLSQLENWVEPRSQDGTSVCGWQTVSKDWKID